MVLFLAGTKTARSDPLDQFYTKLGELNDQTDGPYRLEECDGRMEWPERGIYVFFDPDSNLNVDPPSEWSISRIGTVGVSDGSSNTLWNRLRQHRGNTRGERAGGGNHRGSIFRLHVGRAIIESEGLHDEFPYWGDSHRDDIPLETEALREQEHPLEVRVSDYIRSLPFLVIDVPGAASKTSDRARFEKNLIGLVSQRRRSTPSIMRDGWLGHENPAPEIHRTGLWNIHHVTALYDGAIISDVDHYIQQTDPIS
jgi:hypothetical protein